MFNKNIIFAICILSTICQTINDIVMKKDEILNINVQFVSYNSIDKCPEYSLNVIEHFL